MNIFLPLLVLLFFLTGCGTYRGSHHIVAVDSNIRGVVVENEKREIIGITPFFYKMEPRLEQNLRAFAGDRTGKVFLNEFTYHCDLNWKQSILPAGLGMLIFPIGTLIGASSIVTDTATGNHLDCNKPAFFNISQSLATGQRIVENRDEAVRVLVIPIPSRDEKISSYLYSKWYERSKKAIESQKIILIHPEFTEGDFAYRGIIPQNITDFEKIGDNHLREMAYKYRASHILFFDTDLIDRYRYEVIPVVYDAFNRKKIMSYKLPAHVGKVPRGERAELFDTVRDAINIIPNSLAINIGGRPEVSYIESGLEKNVVSSNHPSSLPKILTVFSIQNVLNPKLYNTWDYAFQTFPSLSGSAWKIQNQDEKDIALINVNLFYNLGLTFHTSFGALTVEVGAGVGHYNIKEDITNKNSYLGTFRTNVNYVGFLSQNLFVLINATSIQPTSGRHLSQYVEFKGYKELTLGLGYYLPTLKGRLRELLPF
jgi:hypothetical protein